MSSAVEEAHRSLHNFVDNMKGTEHGYSILRRMQVVNVGAKSITYRLRVESDMLNYLGSVHGGTHALLADVCTTATASYFHPHTVSSVSVNLSLQYLDRAVEGEHIDVHTTVLRTGKKLAFLDFKIEAFIKNESGDEQNRRLAVTGTHVKYIAGSKL